MRVGFLVSSTAAAAAAVVSLSVLLSSCVRTWERPDDLQCSADDQCASDERCLVWVPGQSDEDYYGEDYGYETGCSDYGYSCSARCVPDNACNEASDCSDGQVCINAYCAEPRCGQDADCSPYTCDVQRGLCRRECYQSAAGTGQPYDPAIACAPPATCSDYSECEVNDCGGDPAVVCGAYDCRGTTCLTSCEGDSDCQPDYVCSLQTCTNKRALGDACADSAECESGLCDLGSCTDPCASVECGDVLGSNCGACPTGYACFENYCDDVCYYDDVECGTYMGADCGACDTGYSCGIDNSCVGNWGTACSGDSDCSSNICCYGSYGYYYVCRDSLDECW